MTTKQFEIAANHLLQDFINHTHQTLNNAADNLQNTPTHLSDTFLNARQTTRL